MHGYKNGNKNMFLRGELLIKEHIGVKYYFIINVNVCGIQNIPV